MRVKKNRKAIVAASIALVLVGGAAFAFWALGGSGTGSVTTEATGEKLTVAQNAPGAMAPGDTITLSGTIYNPNTTSVKLGILSAALGSTAGIDPNEFVLGGESNSDGLIIQGRETLTWKGLTLAYLDSSSVNQNAGMGVKVDLIYTLAPTSELAQVDVSSWDRTIPLDAATIAKGKINLIAGTKVVPADLGAKVATLTTTVKTDGATASVDFNSVASGFISRTNGETIARSTLFYGTHDGDPILYAQDNSQGSHFCWDDKFYVGNTTFIDDANFKFTTGRVTPNPCSVNTTPPGSTNVYITKIFGTNKVTTEVIHDGLSLGTLSRDLPKDPTTQYQPILRTSLTAPAAGVTGALTISNTSLTIQ